jgi:oxygen-dependent protoporphyrinogen oxidase
LLVGGIEHHYDGVVVATPPAAAAGLVAEARTREWLAGVRTRPAVSLVLWTARRVRSPSFGYSFPRREPPGDVVAAACVQSRKLDFGDDPRDAVVVFPAPALLEEGPSDEDLAALVPQALERALPGLPKVLEGVEVHRHDGGYRLFPPGYIRRLASEPPPDPGAMVLAGDYLVAPTVEGAVRSGLRAAERLLARA